MNNDLLKKLLQGLPQQQDELSPQIGYSPAYEVAPNLDPSIYPSPLAYPEPRMAPLDFTNEPADKVMADPMPANINPGLPFNNKNIPMPQQTPPQQEASLPKEDKKPSLAEILAGMKAPGRNSELENAQNDSNDTIRNLLMMKGVNTMAQSLVNQKADPNFLSEHMTLANKKATDVKERQKSDMEQKDQFNKDKNQVIAENKAVFELGDKEKENNADSELSKSFRKFKNDYYSSMGSKLQVPEGMSYADLAKSTGALDQAVMVAYNSKLRNEDKAIAAASSREEKLENKKTRTNENMAKFANTMNEQLKDVVKVKENSVSLKKALESAQKDPSGLRDISAVYKFVKALDSDSAVREGEISLLQAAIPMFDNVKNIVEGQFKGDVSKLSPKARQNMLQIANEYVQAADSAYARKLSSKKAIADDLGIPQSYYDPYSNEKPMKSIAKKQYSPSANKTKIIYNDGSEEIVDGQK